MANLLCDSKIAPPTPHNLCGVGAVIITFASSNVPESADEAPYKCFAESINSLDYAEYT